MKIAITGAGGLIGSHLVGHFAPAHEVLALKHADLDITDREAVGSSVRGPASRAEGSATKHWLIRLWRKWVSAFFEPFSLGAFGLLGRPPHFYVLSSARREFQRLRADVRYEGREVPEMKRARGLPSDRGGRERGCGRRDVRVGAGPDYLNRLNVLNDWNGSNRLNRLRR